MVMMTMMTGSHVLLFNESRENVKCRTVGLNGGGPGPLGEPGNLVEASLLTMKLNDPIARSYSPSAVQVCATPCNSVVCNILLFTAHYEA